MRSLARWLPAALLAIFATAVPASAVSRHHGRVGHHHVRLIPLPGGGTSIHVGGGASGRAVLLSPEAIGAAAVRDIDADGDLDVVASGGTGLLVWRNLGAGRYALAPAPARPQLDPRFGAGLTAFRHSRQASGIGEQRQQIAARRSRLTTRVAPAITPVVPSRTIFGSVDARAHAGRAPPARA